jgi:RNA polymerase sigma-70 factor (ECF subfamily)
MESFPDRSDGELAASIATGDQHAFMIVYDAHAPILFGVVARMLGDREVAAEVVQEVFVVLWQRASRYEPDLGSLRTWLMRIARNRALDRLRADARRPTLIRPPDPAQTGGDAVPEAWDQGDEAGEAPGDTAERRWTQAVVRSALAEMPEDERHVLALAYDAGLSQSEIATKLGLPLGTVKSRTRRAMARLRAVLAAVPDLAGAPGPGALSPGGTSATEARHGPR